MAFLFGDPRLFVMGAELTMYDPATGNVVGYDNVGSDAAISYTFDFTEVVGGMQNQLVGLIPHTTRLTGSYTSQAFSLAHRALLSGGSLTYNAVAPVCETIKATATTLTVSKTPAKAQSQASTDTYAWCYVRPHDAATYEGVNYGVDISTKAVQNFTATVNDYYDVFYFTEWASAQQLALPAGANPSIVAVHQKWAVYSEQNGSRSQGTLQGYLYVVVPKAMLEGDAGIDGNQTSNSTTTYNWRALSGAESNKPICADCDSSTADLAYYIYVPCGTALDAVVDMVVLGGDPTLTIGTDEQLKIRLVMKDGSTVLPDYSTLAYVSGTTGKVTVNDTGVLHPVSAGSSVITTTLTKSDSSTIVNKTTVTVVSA